MKKQRLEAKPAAAAPGYHRHLVTPAGAPTRFWRIDYDGKKTTRVRFGKLGAEGRAQETRHKDEYKAREAFYKTSNAKLAEDWVCVHEEPSVANGYIALLLKTRGGFSHYVDLHPVDGTIAIGGGIAGDERLIQLLDPKTGAVISEIANPRGGVRALRFSPDGRLLAWQDNHSGPQPHVHDFATGAEWRPKVPNATGMADGLEFDASGRRLLVVTPTKAQLFDVVDREEIFAIRQRDAEDRIAAALSPDGRRVAFSSAARDCVEIHDVERGAVVQRLALGAGKGSEGLVFHPDGRHLLALYVWFEAHGAHATLAFDLESGAPALPEVFGDEEDALHFTATFSPDGRLLATAGYHSYVELREWPSGRVVLRFFDHYRRVYDARFSADGRRLLTADYNGGFVCVHALPPELLAAGYEGPFF